MERILKDFFHAFLGHAAVEIVEITGELDQKVQPNDNDGQPSSSQPSTSRVGTSCSKATEAYDDDDIEEEGFADEDEELSGCGEHSKEESFDDNDYDAVVVCLGAGVSKLEEFSGKLPLTYCRGVVTHLVLPPAKKKDFEFEGPSIVGDTWIAAQGSRNLVVGATKDWDNCETRANVEPEAAAIACSELFTKTAAFYPPIRNWVLQGTCAGVRAMAPRTPYGKVPLAGCIDEVLNYRPSRKSSSPYYWIFGGLGSRGLIYHAWLGKKVAEAVVSRSETCLPRELLLWKWQGNCKPVFSID
ncbi:hypothetical protein L7F22_038548 [Adiantum nelumboides]|nr:hypothetical protein [Adiantum nelumboides]